MCLTAPRPANHSNIKTNKGERYEHIKKQSTLDKELLDLSQAKSKLWRYTMGKSKRRVEAEVPNFVQIIGHNSRARRLSRAKAISINCRLNGIGCFRGTR